MKGDKASFRELIQRIKSDPRVIGQCQQLMEQQPPPGIATTGEQYMLLATLINVYPRDTPADAEHKRHLMLEYLDAAIIKGNSLAMVQKAAYVITRDDENMLLKYEAVELLRRAAALQEPEALKVLNSPNFEDFEARLQAMESSLPPKQSSST